MTRFTPSRRCRTRLTSARVMTTGRRIERVARSAGPAAFGDRVGDGGGPRRYDLLANRTEVVGGMVDGGERAAHFGFGAGCALRLDRAAQVAMTDAYLLLQALPGLIVHDV